MILLTTAMACALLQEIASATASNSPMMWFACRSAKNVEAQRRQTEVIYSGWSSVTVESSLLARWGVVLESQAPSSWRCRFGARAWPLGGGPLSAIGVRTASDSREGYAPRPLWQGSLLAPRHPPCLGSNVSVRVRCKAELSPLSRWLLSSDGFRAQVWCALDLWLR